MNELEYRLSAAWLRAWYLLFAWLPVKRDTVVLASARAVTLEGNLRYIADALAEMRPDLRVVPLLDRYRYDLLGKIAYLLKLTRATCVIARARYVIVDNAYLPLHIAPHRKGTTVIQVWHAVGALKKFGLDTAPPNRVVENGFIHRYYDYVVVGSESARAPYASALRTDITRVLPLGVARTDFFADPAAEQTARDRVLQALPQLAGKRVVLYAPTFRGHGEGKAPSQELDAKALRAALPDGYALVHKTHPVFSAADIAAEGWDAVVGAEIDINELFTVTDVLVTDYSSSLFEYALMHKPLVLLVGDLAGYEKDPGLYLDYATEMIGVQVATTDDVARIIASEDFDLSGYDRFIEAHCTFDRGGASKRLVEFLGTLP